MARQQHAFFVQSLQSYLVTVSHVLGSHSHSAHLTGVYLVVFTRIR